MLDINRGWQFRCLGDDQAPGQEFWLDGNTTTGIVGLAPSSGSPFSGTNWAAVNLDGGSSQALICLGTDLNPQHVFLDGHVGDQSFNPVKLAPTTDRGFTGTHWIIEGQRVGTVGLGIVDAVYFVCLGSGDGPRFLDGVTASQDPSQRRVKLSPTITLPFHGTRWEAISFPLNRRFPF